MSRVSSASKGVEGARAHRSKSPFQAVQLGFFVLMVVVVAAGLWGVVQQRPQAGGIPEEILGYGLVRSIQGQQAIAMVDRLHQGSPQLTNAWVAYYDGGGTVWTGTTASPYAAQEQVEAMAQAIGKGETPFSNLQEMQLAGHQVFTISDGTNAHYFFQSGSQVIWVLPPAETGTRFVEAALREL